MPLRRWAVALLARRRGEVRAIQDLRALTQSLRFAGIFALLMLLPTGFLAWQALSSVNTVELALDVDLQRRARALSSSIQAELQGVFSRFERVSLTRLENRESVSDNLKELSPHLRAAYRFDSNGVLVAPFELAPAPLPAEPPAVWREAAREARELEPRNPRRAVRAWRSLYRSNDRPALQAEAKLGEVRALMRAGDLDRAKSAALDLLEQFAGIRNRHGFRMDDIALFMSLQIDERRGRDPDLMRVALEDLATRLLARRWEVGREGEPALIGEILQRLQRRSSGAWLGSMRKQLHERYAQLAWTSKIQQELDNVFVRLPEERQFRYLGARPDSEGVWALVRVGEDVFAFCFSVRDLLRDLHAEVRAQTVAERDLSASLYVADDRVPPSVMSERSLGPQLPSVVLGVAPTDPEALERAKRRRRTVRIGVVLTAVFVSVVGAWSVARMIALEVEGARQRADFAANVSHELRSPITQIRLKGEALQLGLVDPGDDMQDHFAAIVRESERLSRLVDNVLDFAAIERGAKRYHLRLEDIVPIVVASVEAARSTFEERGMEVRLDVPDDLPPLRIDREAMAQVMTNLLSNAAKYGGEGQPVDVTVVARPATVELRVADRGVGIDPEELPRVFDDFFRSQDPAVRRRKGTGIGLAIVRYIVDAHGGSIRVESQPGEGATFIIDLPREP